MLRIDFEPIGKRVDVEGGTTLLAAALQAGLEIAAVCGGQGTCERCRVQIVAGRAPAANLTEQVIFSAAELAANWRLACQVEVAGPLKVYVPPESLSTPQRLQLEGADRLPSDHGRVRLLDLELCEPDLIDLRADCERLLAAAQDADPTVAAVDPALLASLSESLRRDGWRGRAVVADRRVIAWLPPGAAAYGLAVDIGTTKLAAYLIDLDTQATVGRASAMNPQIHYGEDVLSRIFYCMEHPTGRAELQACLVAALNDLARTMTAALGAQPEQVVDAAVVGNTAMHHLFAGLPVKQLGLMPFVPAISSPLTIPAASVGLQLAPAADVYLPSNIAGYVGADHVAMLLATAAERVQGTVLTVDIGTNTEISLIHAGKIFSCSCASGPAFEGAHIQDGMRAAAGAIEGVHLHADAGGITVQLHTIDHRPPVGICGSGILDAVAEMVRVGILDERGVFAAKTAREFVLAEAAVSGSGRAIVITRRDVHEILLAKAAIRTGIEILLRAAGITGAQVEQCLVAGAFGTYLDLGSAVRIGMLPPLPLARFQQVGNAAGSGARLLLLSAAARQAAAAFAPQVHYIELTAHPDFKTIFMDTMDFRPAKPSLVSNL